MSQEVNTVPYLSKDQIATAREMDLLTYLRRFDPEELVHIGGNTYTTRTHDSPENLQREMVLVVAGYRRHNCTGLSDNSGGCFLFGCRAAYPWGTAPCADQIRANRTAPEN